jgi:hypothetical protein
VCSVQDPHLDPNIYSIRVLTLPKKRGATLGDKVCLGFVYMYILFILLRGLCFSKNCSFFVSYSRKGYSFSVSDTHSSYADQDPAFLTNADPDPMPHPNQGLKIEKIFISEIQFHVFIKYCLSFGFFLSILAYFTFQDPDLNSECGAGSRKPIECGTNADPDPSH